MTETKQTEQNPQHVNVIVLSLLNGILEKTIEQNVMIKAFVAHQNTAAQQTEVWKNDNRELSKRYGQSALLASKLMHGFMVEMTEALETLDTDESFEHNFQFMEFIDKYGQRVQQLNMLLQMLSNLGTFT